MSHSSLSPVARLAAWLPDLPRAIWILTAGQVLLFVGQGFTMVYASIYFVNVLGFSATQVGVALSCSQVAGFFGRFAAGNATDSEILGRRRTLLLAALLAALASFCLAIATTFSVLVAGNVLMGLGLSFYWPATLSVVADLTGPAQRAEAFTLTRLADTLGLGAGAILAGQWLALSDSYSALFVAKGIAYLAFLVVVYLTIPETYKPSPEPRSFVRVWSQPLGDRRLLLWLGTNVFFTSYIALASSILPLYFANFIPGGGTETGFAEQTISYLISWQVFCKAIAQLPVARAIERSTHYTTALMVSLGFWAIGYAGIWAAGAFEAAVVLWLVVGAMTVLAVAEALYLPCGSVLVSELAPESARGAYFALESQCWGFGFFLAPLVGGWALDHPDLLGKNLWAIAVGSAAIALALVIVLRQRLRPAASEASVANQ